MTKARHLATIHGDRTGEEVVALREHAYSEATIF